MDRLQIETRALSSLLNDISKDKFDFDHPLQRKSGQWKQLEISKLIDSVVRLYPILPILVEYEENGKYGVIDGKQRLTILKEYAENNFSLHKSLEPVVIDDIEYQIGTKKFDKLDDAVKDRFLNREIQIYIMTNATEKDICEIFARINSSNGLTNTQRRTVVESAEFREIIHTLSSHPIFNKSLSPSQIKKDLNKDIIRESLMLITTDKEHDYADFTNKSINNFISLYQENIEYDKIDILKQSLDKLDESFEELKINSSSLPMVFYGSYRITKDKKSFSKFVELVNNFIKTYDENDEYKQFCGQGTRNGANVRARFDYWREMLRTM